MANPFERLQSPQELLIEKYNLKAGERVALRKTRVLDGKTSDSKLGTTIRGTLSSNVSLSQPIEFEEGGATSELIDIAENDGKLWLKTQTSVYELVTDEVGHEESFEQRLARIQPLPLGNLKSRPEVKHAPIDSNNFVLQKEGEKVISGWLNGKKIFELPNTTLHEIQTSEGQTLRVLLNRDPQSPVPYAAYNPSGDIYMIGPKGIEMLDQDELVFEGTLLHEMGHEEYYKLSKSDQEQLADILTQEPELKTALEMFARTLYEDPIGGKTYLRTHSVNNATRFVEEGLTGIKDARSFTVSGDGQDTEIFAGELITEAISNLSTSLLGEEAFQKAIEYSTRINGYESPRFAAKRYLFKKLRENPRAMAFIKQHDVFKGRKDLKILSAQLKKIATEYQ